MKYLTPQFHDNENALNVLSENKRLSSYPDLKVMRAHIEFQYQHYLGVKGNVLELNAPISLDMKLAVCLRSHYSGNIAALDFIKKIRKSLSPRVCPMCGSPKTGQVDHITPKDEYPEFAIYSYNLVPACDCNALKGIVFRNVLTNERVLHPYFDEILKKRLTYLSFKKNGIYPIIEVEIVVGVSNERNVRYHINNILKKTNVVEFAIQLWGQISDDPNSLLFLSTEDFPVTEDLVEKSLVKILSMKDREFGTPNNWYSMFFGGILIAQDRWAIKHIVDCFNREFASLTKKSDLHLEKS